MLSVYNVVQSVLFPWELQSEKMLLTELMNRLSQTLWIDKISQAYYAILPNAEKIKKDSQISGVLDNLWWAVKESNLRPAD